MSEGEHHDAADAAHTPPSPRREEEVAGSPDPDVERRVDRTDTRWYSRPEFLEHYGGSEEWDAAPQCVELRVDADGLGYTRDAFTRMYGEEGEAKWRAARVAPVTRIGVVLDLHYVEVQAKQFSLKTAWDPKHFEASIEKSLNGIVSERVACDSDPIHTDDRMQSGKQRLHHRLRDSGYNLQVSPPKRVPKGQAAVQGATDIDVSVQVFKLAGAFAADPEVDCICLCSGDSDFRPLVEYVLDARKESHGLRVVVVAAEAGLRHEYRRWLTETPGCELLELMEVLQRVAPHVVNMRAGSADPDPAAAASALIDSLRGYTPDDGHNRGITLELSGHGVRWGDKQMSELAAEVYKAADGDASLFGRLGELWVHHTNISDASCGGGMLDRLVRVASHMRELHLSDTRVSEKGLLALAQAAYDTRSAKKGRKKGVHLYINADHIAAVDLAAEHHRGQDGEPAKLKAISHSGGSKRCCVYSAPGNLGDVVSIKLSNGDDGGRRGKGKGKGKGGKGDDRAGKGKGDDRAGKGKGDDKGGKGKKDRGGAHKRIELVVPPERRGLLIGAKAKTLKALQEEYGVVLKVPRMDDPASVNVVVEGPAGSVAACHHEVSRRVHGECELAQ